MNGHDLLRLNRLQKVAAVQRYAKLAADQSHFEVTCPDSGYADLTGKKYPCHTKTAAFQSALLAADDQVTDPVVLAKLAKFASFWDIEKGVATCTAAIAMTKVSASPDELSDDEYALVATHNGEKIRKFASYDVESTVAAADAFYEQRTKFPFAWRKTAAERLLATATKHGAVLPNYINEYLLKAACVARPTEDSVDAGFAQRFELSHKRDDDVMSKLGQVLTKVAEHPGSFDSADLADILDAVDTVDREIKLAQYYDMDRLELPEEMLVVTKRTIKVASTPVRLMNGQTVDASQLTKEALASVDESLAGMTLAKLAEVLPTLPVPDANLLMHMMPKSAADMSAGSLTDDNFAAQTTPAALAPAPAVAPAASPAPSPAPQAPAVSGSAMIDPGAGAGPSKMAPIASGAAAQNFSANGSNLPTNQTEQTASDQKSAAGAGAMLGTQHTPLQ